MNRTSIAALLLLAPLSVSPARGAEISLHFTAVEKILHQRMFTDEGRSFLFGGSRTPCSQASLSNPRVSSRGRRILVAMDFSGSLGVQVGDECVGLFDESSFQVLGSPAAAGGTVYLRDIEIVEQSEVPQFADFLNEFAGSSLRKFFQVDITEEVRRAFEEFAGAVPFAIDLSALEVSGIALGEESMDLDVDISLTVR